MALFAALYLVGLSALIAQRCHVTGCATERMAQVLCGSLLLSGLACLIVGR